MRLWATKASLFALAFIASESRASDLTVRSGQRLMIVSALSDSVIRVRIAPEGKLAEDASWAVAANVRAKRAATEMRASVLKTSLVSVSVDPASFAIKIQDKSGKVILSDDVFPITNAAKGFTLRKRLGRSEQVYGMGDKTGGLNRRGKSFVNWNTDNYGFKSHDDPLYKSIPFYISVGGPGGAYGLFLDNPYRSWFDFGHKEDGVLAFGAEDGPIDYYIIAGPEVKDVVRRYTALTGKAPLPPRWVLGYQQSRWSYMSEAEVRSIADRLRQERVPTDVIWLDIDFQDRNRPFTIDKRTFPNFVQMVSDLNTQGIKTVAITDLHIAAAPDEGYKPYDDGLAGDHFLKNADGSLYIGPVWPGPSVFPDFTRAETRGWWGQQFRELIDDGVAGIWNDMNEPAIFETPTKTMPLDVVHHIDTDGFASRMASHREVHNIYGMENTRATYEGLRALRPNDRAFVMTRASYAGGQRYAATWTGDNSSSWDHLKLALSQTLNLGLSGFAWAGADVGGFTGGPSADLLTRWFQFAAFAPIFRDHSQKDAPRAEPWVDGPEHLAIRRRYVEERYRLLPYFYALADTNSRQGDPITRPIIYDYPEMLTSDCDMSMQFTLGDKLLVAGSPTPESPRPYRACLPKGGWYDYWTGTTVPEQGVQITPKLDILPVFVKAGTALPRQPLTQSTSFRPEGPLELHIYPGPKGCEGELYDDDGRSMAFEKGVYARQSITCQGSTGRLFSVRLSAQDGSFTPWWREIRMVIHGPQRYSARMGGQKLSVVQAVETTSVLLPRDPRGQIVQLTPTN